MPTKDLLRNIFTSETTSFIDHLAIKKQEERPERCRICGHSVKDHEKHCPNAEADARTSKGE